MKELKQAITDRQHALPDFELGKLQLAWEEKALDTIPAPPTEGLLAHYELDGSVSDTSGHYHHGSVNGKISYSEGRVGRSASVRR